MRAAVYHRYGAPEVVQIEDIPTPEPKAGEVLIRVRATTVTAADWRVRSLSMPRGFGVFGRLAFGLFGPRKKVLGMAVAGEVAACGAGVASFAVKDRVLADCGAKMGAHAAFCVVKADGTLAKIPDGLSFEDSAALVFGGSTALHFLRNVGKVQPGERVLINGASGETGVAFVQLARHFGADVVGVCSAANAELVRGLGAERVVDYTQEDFALSDEKYDVIVDTVGNAGWVRSHGALKDNGRLLQVLAGLADMIKAPLVSRRTGRKALAGEAKPIAADLVFLADLAVKGEFIPVISQIFELEDIVEAHRLVDSGHKVGSVVVRL
ncbi:MAG: zinc-binding dehydrogenase [Rhodobacteraceae bacterium]|nr:zinc-binding dehydrogenase [Paracoccaceae bacterium]